jgi:hypothetical protein
MVMSPSGARNQEHSAGWQANNNFVPWKGWNVSVDNDTGLYKLDTNVLR